MAPPVGEMTQHRTDLPGPEVQRQSFGGRAGHGACRYHRRPVSILPPDLFERLAVHEAPLSDDPPARRAAVAAILGNGHEGQTYELAGDTAFSLTDLAAVTSRIGGADIPYRDLPEPDYARALSDSGLDAPWPDFLARVDAQIARGALFDESGTLSRLIGHPTTPLDTVLASALGAS